MSKQSYHKIKEGLSEALIIAKICSLMDRYPYGTELSVEHDGFAGTVVGYYITREGNHGLSLQLHNAKVVHVYSEKWFTKEDA